MRMGRPAKKRKPTRRKETVNPNPPKFSSPTLVVGQVSSNVVRSVLAPALEALAVRSAEEYADAVMDYESTVARVRMERAALVAERYEGGGGEEVELDLDGNIVQKEDDVPLEADIDLPPPPSSRRLFATQSDVDELSALLSETSASFSSPGNAWKISANAAKFERLLDEKYGRFRPFIESHPRVETFIKGVQRKYAMGAFSPFRKEAPINKSTAVMMLFMMHRQNVRFEALVLTATFCLVGLQPWALVALVALGKWEVDRRKWSRVRGMPRKLKVCEPYYDRDGSSDPEEDEEEESEEAERARKYGFLERPVGTRFEPADLSIRDEDFNVLLLGSGVETLYTAALLARAGRKVCVLSPSEDVSECVVMAKPTQEGSKFAGVPFDVRGANFSHLARQQHLLAPALCTSTDVQGGIRFARIGGASDGYAHSVLSVPGLGTDNVNADPIPVVINAEGPRALAEYCSTYLGDGYPGTDLDGKDDGSSSSLGYVKACRQINAGSGDHHLSKLFDATNALSKSSESNVYRQATIRPASAFLNKCLPLNAHVRSLMAAMGMANENLGPDNTSMAAHVSHLCAMTSEEGMSYPVGGPRALCHALASVVEQCGGRVVSSVSLQELLFEELPEKDEKDRKKKKREERKEGEDVPFGKGPQPRCRGVRLQNGCEVTVSETASGEEGAVVSTLGLIPTFLHLLPADVRSAYGVPPGLPAVSERRPLIKVLVGLNGTKDELDLTGADWYRLPNATLPRDELDRETGRVKFGTIGVNGAGDPSGEDSDEPTAAASGSRGKRSRAPAASDSSTRRSKFATGSSWMKVSFPSAKDPSWPDRHGNVSTCVVTIEADDDFVKMFDTKPRIYSILGNDKSNSASGNIERLSNRVMKDLVENFPQLEGKVECVQICGPYRSGLAQDVARFAIKGNRPRTYPGLFIGGSDLTVSDSASAAVVGGWLAANAVMGYSPVDHAYLNKDVTSDLRRFLDEPGMETTRGGTVVEDLAVPFEEKKKYAGGGGGGGGEATNAAESSKEE